MSLSESKVNFIQSNQSIASILLVVFFSLIIFAYQRHLYSYWSSRKVKGPRPLPFIGNNLNFIFQPLHLLDQSLVRSHGRLVGLYDATTPVLLVTQIDLINEISIKRFHAFVDRRDFNEHKTMVKFLGALQGNEWKRVRSLMSPTFSSGKIRAMTHLMDGPIKSLCRELHALSIKSSPVELKSILCKLILDITVRSSFGVELKSNDELSRLTIKHAMQVLTIKKHKVLLAFTLPTFIRRLTSFSIFPIESIEFMTNLTKSMMNERINNPKTTRNFPDFVDLMIDAMKDSDDGTLPLTMEEAIANGLLMLVAGFETTASLLTYTLFCLAHHQNAQDRLRQELKSLPTEASEDVNVLRESLSSLNYLDCVINETLRLYPPVTRTERIANQDVTLNNGINIKTGTVVAFPIYAIQRDSEYWKDADSFKPERFLPENKSKIVPHSFIPFHEGPRNCIGMRFALMEAKLTLARLVSNFKFSSSSSTQWPLEFPTASFLLTQNCVYVNAEKI